MVLVGGVVGRNWLARCRQAHARSPSRRKILGDMQGMGEKVGQVGKAQLRWESSISINENLNSLSTGKAAPRMVSRLRLGALFFLVGETSSDMS